MAPLDEEMDTTHLIRALDRGLELARGLDGGEPPDPNAPANDSHTAEVRRTLTEIAALAQVVNGDVQMMLLELRGVPDPRW